VCTLGRCRPGCGAGLFPRSALLPASPTSSPKLVEETRRGGIVWALEGEYEMMRKAWQKKVEKKSNGDGVFPAR